VAGCGDMKSAQHFFFAASLALFDRQLGRGLIFHRWILFTWVIIFFGSFFHPVVSEHATHSFNLFGSYVSESFGMREINVYL
jgi:hypothetical protein